MSKSCIRNFWSKPDPNLNPTKSRRLTNCAQIHHSLGNSCRYLFSRVSLYGVVTAHRYVTVKGRQSKQQTVHCSSCPTTRQPQHGTKWLKPYHILRTCEERSYTKSPLVQREFLTADKSLLRADLHAYVSTCLLIKIKNAIL